MNAQPSPEEFVLDGETDKLFERIAESGNQIAPDLLRDIIPSREALVRYLEQHHLTDYPIAQSVLAQYDALPAPPQKTSGLKSMLARAMAGKLNLPSETTAALIDLLVETAISEIKNRGEFLIPGVGRLVKVVRPARVGRNPQTGEEMEIEPKLTVKFRPLKAAKEAVAEAGKVESGRDVA
ncbi:MAG TPA: HU family DNA-binding protein [Terriglobales bacterium]|nr:HU family DNA-binding protein [Terriglobales bacterium]